MALKNKLIDLNNHLFAQLERLSDENTKGDTLNEEIERSKAIGLTVRNIIDNARGLPLKHKRHCLIRAGNCRLCSALSVNQT